MATIEYVYRVNKIIRKPFSKKNIAFSQLNKKVAEEKHGGKKNRLWWNQ